MTIPKPVSRLAKACFVSLGLLLIGSAAQSIPCQSEKAILDRLDTEHSIANAKRNSLLKAPLSELCPAARYSASLLDAWNNAYKNAASCYCRNGGDCSVMMSEYSTNVEEATRQKRQISQVCD